MIKIADVQRVFQISLSSCKMGTYLSTPNTDLETEEGTSSNGMMYGVSSMQGWRSGMEDAYVSDLEFDPSRNLSLFGVFDGHGGPEVAIFCRNHIANVIKNTDSYKKGGQGDLGESLIRTFLELDVKLSTREGVKELRVHAMEEDQRRKMCIEDLDLDEISEAADACGLSTSQLKALISSQLSARLQAKRNEADLTSDDENLIDTVQQGVKTENVPSSQTTSSSSCSDSSTSSSSSSETCSTATSSSQSPYASLRPTLRKGGVGVESGATSVVALLGEKELIVANAGDSRCVLCRNNQAIEMSIDHKPEDHSEMTRVRNAGGTIVDGRIEGNLNLSRAIGDLAYKRNLQVNVEDQMITALPDIKTIELTPQDQFVVLACDGIWNVLESEEVVDFIVAALARSPPPSPGLICEEILNNCLAPDTEGDGSGCDNMTMMLILLPPSLGAYTNGGDDIVLGKRNAVESVCVAPQEDNCPISLSRKKLSVA